MKTPTLNIDIDYDLIAINTTLEDYLLALNINRKLKISLSRTKNDFIFNTAIGQVEFVQYVFEDVTNDLYWHLIQNRKWMKITTNHASLFAQVQQLVFLSPELKNANYLLKIEKIEPENFHKQHVLNQIKEIKQLSTVFFVDIDKLNLKNNLLF